MSLRKRPWMFAVERAAGPDFLPVAPTWETGPTKGAVPYCTERCSHHDGKRCALLGCRPSVVCEPAVAGMAGILADMDAKAGAV